MPDNQAQDRPRISRLFARAMRRRCPNCGHGPIFRSWFRTLDACPACHLRLERTEAADYWMGGYLVNFIIAELIVAGVLVAAVVMAWPDVRWNLVLYGTTAAAVIGPLLTWPFSRTLWLGLDLAFRPPEAVDFEGTGAKPDAESTGQTGESFAE